jgi:hypothetical protein
MLATVLTEQRSEEPLRPSDAARVLLRQLRGSRKRR